MTDLTPEATLVELLAALSEDDNGIPAVDHVPPSVEPPLAVALPAEPFMQPADDYGDTVTIDFDLVLLFAAAEGDEFTRAALRIIQNVLLNLPVRWHVVSVSAPFIAKNLGGIPAVRVRISTTSSITESE